MLDCFVVPGKSLSAEDLLGSYSTQSSASLGSVSEREVVPELPSAHAPSSPSAQGPSSPATESRSAHGPLSPAMESYASSDEGNTTTYDDSDDDWEPPAKKSANKCRNIFIDI